MIVIEGPDNAGKSTLVTQLLEMDPSLRILYRDRYKADQQETIATSYIRALLPKPHGDGDRVVHGHAIADRLFASECIYGDLFRGGCRMSEGEHLAVRNLLNTYAAVVVHVDAPDETILESWKKRDQLYDDPTVIARAYRERLTRVFSTSNVLHYDWTKRGAEHVRKSIIAVHKFQEKRTCRALAWWGAVPHGVGKLIEPRVILVGESPSPQANTPVPFANGPAGDFLAWAINEAAHKLPALPRELYITNAVKGTGHDTAILREELSFLVRRTTVVIPLGREAEEMVMFLAPTLPQSPLAIVPMFHPQFWRRFHYPERQKYVKTLLDAVTLTLGA